MHAMCQRDDTPSLTTETESLTLVVLSIEVLPYESASWITRTHHDVPLKIVKLNE